MNEDNYMEMLEEENRRLLEELDNANDTVECLKKEKEVLIKQVKELVEVKNKKSEIIKKHFEKLGDIKKQIDESFIPIKDAVKDCMEDAEDDIKDTEEEELSIVCVMEELKGLLRE